MKSVKVFLGLLAGFATGTLAGILFAPEKGSKTRKKILRKSEDYTDAVKEKFNESFEEITEKFEKVKKDVSDYADKKMGNSEKAEKETKS